MKSSSEITDRAKRYRANNDVPDGLKVCMFCGRTKDLGVDHIDGYEENGEPENLMWLCRSCNQLKSAVYKAAGIGRRTEQFNPSRIFQDVGVPGRMFNGAFKQNPWSRLDPREIQRRGIKERGAESMKRAGVKHHGSETQKQYREVSRLVGQGLSLREALAEAGNPAKITGRYKGFTLIRAELPGYPPVYASTISPDTWMMEPEEAKELIDTFKNPASSYDEWLQARGVLMGQLPGSPFRAARVVRSTPVAKRYKYLDRLMRKNPGASTFAQYAWAVTHHERGAHDEGGAVIHATPKAKRREYAGRIADVKRGRRDAEVPF